MLVDGDTKDTAASPRNAIDTNKPDPFAMLASKSPELSELTHDTFPNYMSLFVAAIRGAEAKLPNGVSIDTFAEVLAGAPGRAFVEFFGGIPENPEIIGYAAIRGLMIDEEIEENLSPKIQQAVVIGSGMDSRSYRLKKLANCHVFELDSSRELADHKDRVLKDLDANLIPRAHDVIITNLAAYSWPEELVEHGFDPNKPTVWIIEALLQYLDDDGVDRLFETIDSLSAPHSVNLVEYSGTGKTDMDIVINDEGKISWKIGSMEKRIEGGPLRACKWNIEKLINRDEQAVYSGRRWDPVRFAHYHIPKDKAHIGPYFVASCTKPSAEGNNSSC